MKRINCSYTKRCSWYYFFSGQISKLALRCYLLTILLLRWWDKRALIFQKWRVSTNYLSLFGDNGVSTTENGNKTSIKSSMTSWTIFALLDKIFFVFLVFISYLCPSDIGWWVCLTVRTRGFHPRNRSSILLPTTKILQIKKLCLAI